MLLTDDLLKHIRRYTKIKGECWICELAVSSNGYAHVTIEGKVYATHRVIGQKYLGLDIEDSSTFVCHKDDICFSKACWNPDHLYLGTRADNLEDAKLAGKTNFSKTNTLKTHCPKGHEYKGWNLIVRRGNQRECRTCINFKSAERAIKRRKKG